MQCAPQTEQHRWLQKFVGTWNLEADCLGPDGKSEVWKTTEDIKAVGDYWLVCEQTAEGFTSLMHLGYDPGRESFVGSWIDTMHASLWNMTGELSADETTLTLAAEGPNMHDPSKMARYRDQLEYVDADRKRMVSSMQADDGSWTVFMTVEGTRIK